MRHTNNFATAIVLALGILLGATTALAESVRGDIDFIPEQNKLKTAIPLGQVMDYGILKEVLAEMKR
jgi:hypothetical protein